MERTFGLLCTLAVALSGCYLEHGRSSPDSGAARDAATRRDSGPATGLCEDPAVELRVTLDDTCPSEPFVTFVRQITAEGGTLRIAGQTGSPLTDCTVEVRFLGEDISRRIAAALSARASDGYVAVGPNSIEFRDTSLCDGPPPQECPLIFAAETGLLQTRAGGGQIDIAWGDTVCEGDCGTLRELEVSLDVGGGFEATARPSAIAELGVFRFASMRPWNTCTDEPSTITWALWAE